jgi:hypothetical protein
MSCVIEQAYIERGGIRFRVFIEADETATFADDEGLSASDIAAHKRGEWQFARVRVTVLDLPERKTDSDGDAEVRMRVEASMRGLVYGHLPAETEKHNGGMHGDVTYLMADVLADDDVTGELVQECRNQLRAARDALSKMVA